MLGEICFLFLILSLIYIFAIFVPRYNTKQHYHMALNKERLGDFKGAREILLSCQTKEKYVNDKISELTRIIHEEEVSKDIEISNFVEDKHRIENSDSVNCDHCGFANNVDNNPSWAATLASNVLSKRAVGIDMTCASCGYNFWLSIEEFRGQGSGTGAQLESYTPEAQDGFLSSLARDDKGLKYHISKRKRKLIRYDSEEYRRWKEGK